MSSASSRPMRRQSRYDGEGGGGRGPPGPPLSNRRAGAWHNALLLAGGGPPLSVPSCQYEARISPPLDQARIAEALPARSFDQLVGEREQRRGTMMPSAQGRPLSIHPPVKQQLCS